ncbi:lactoylglutathione lyase [Methylophilaceae bacterium]|nr:lactoylglutathione lyase [Methylophilaceae bacterium]
MKRMHVHISVDDLAKSIRFYNDLFGSSPAIEKTDYAKWMLDDPRVNFAISRRGNKPGLDHLGIQVESDSELLEIRDRLEKAGLSMLTQTGTTCCYAKSDKHWVQDPCGIAWESYHTLDNAPTFNEAADDRPDNACCAPAQEAIKLIARKISGCK